MIKNADIVNEKTSELNYHHKDNEPFNKKFITDKEAFTYVLKNEETNFLKKVINLFISKQKNCSEKRLIN